MNFVEQMGWSLPVALDGAFGTMLQKGGLEPGKSTISQNIENPELVLEIHRKYIAAGSSAISANTFGGNFIALKSAGLEDKAEILNLEGMRLAKQAVSGTSAKVAADIGPGGDFQRDFDREKMFRVFTGQAEIIMKEPPNFFFIQTMFDLREAVTALEAVKSVAGEIPVAASMTFNKTKRGFFTIMGDPAVKCMEKLQESGADAVGSNCTLLPEEMVELTESIRNSVSVPLIMQPNAGQPEIEGTEVIYRIEPEDFARGLLRISDAGADIIGGCCGSTPEMIKMTVDLLNK